MNYIIFEDSLTDLLSPFTKLHATCELRTGAFTNLERILNLISKSDSVQFYVRDEIKDLLSIKGETVINLVINGILTKS